MITRLHTRLLCLCMLALTPAAVSNALEHQDTSPGFDFDHVRAALDYFETPSERGISRIAFTDASEHLKRHSDRAGYYPRIATRLDIAADLVKNPPDEGTKSSVKALIARLAGDRALQNQCFSEAHAMLPADTKLDRPLYVTWGYDIGVSMAGTASLNAAHPHFLNDPEEIWYYCIHELHHAGFMTINPFPFTISNISHTAELLALVDYATLLEGSAVYAAYDARKKAGALDGDEDYVVLDSPILMRGLIEEYNRQRDSLSGMPRDVTDTDWAVIEAMSGGDRLWYRVGAHMARTIDEKSGRERLIRAIAGGPGAFFRAYDRAQQ